MRSMTEAVSDGQPAMIGSAGSAGHAEYPGQTGHIGQPDRPAVTVGDRVTAGGRSRTAPSLLARAWAEVRYGPVERKFLYILFLLFIAKGVIYTIVFPAFSGHDEVAHYTYIRYVAEEGRVPIIPDLDEWQALNAQNQVPGEDRLPNELYKYCQYFTADWWRGCSETQWLRNPPRMINLANEYYPSGWVYTANHPPMYYVMMTPLYWVSSGQSPEGQLYLFRLAAIPFGLATVLLAFLTTRTLFPGDRFLAMTVPAFVAFQPQVSYEAAMLNNDIVAIALTSWVLYLAVKGLRDRFPVRTCVLLGFVLGLAVLTKGTSVTAAPIIAFAMFFGLGWRNVRQWLPKGALVAAITGVMIWPWYLFLWAEYGDFSGLTRVKALQWWNYDHGDAPTVLDQLLDSGFAWMRWHETWGYFGWRLIPLADWLLWTLFGFLVFATAGLIVYLVRALRVRRALRAATAEVEADSATDDRVETKPERVPPAVVTDPVLAPVRWQVVGIATVLMTCLVAYYAILQFGTQFSLTQARYYFPAINAFALLLMLGVRSWFPRRWYPYVQTVVFVALVALNISIFSQFVIPYWNSGL